MQWKPDSTVFEDLVQCLSSCDSDEAAFELSMRWRNCVGVIMGSGPGAAADGLAAGYYLDPVDGCCLEPWTLRLTVAWMRHLSVAQV